VGKPQAQPLQTPPGLSAQWLPGRMNKVVYAAVWNVVFVRPRAAAWLAAVLSLADAGVAANNTAGNSSVLKGADSSLW